MNADGEPKVLSKGDIFGEKALLENTCRGATIKVVGGPMECLCLDREAFNLLLGPLGDLMNRKIKEEYDQPIVRTAKPRAKRFITTPREELRTIGTLGKGSFGHVKLV